MSTISPRHLEGIARELLDELALDAPIDAFTLAARCGCTLRPVGGARASLDPDTLELRYPHRVRLARLHMMICHELGHSLLYRAGLDHRDEAAADYLAGALLLPREAFLRDLAETDWDLPSLQARHPNASAQGIVVRMTQVSPATASVWDAGRLHRVYGDEHDLEEARRLVDLALELEQPVCVNDVRAWPVIDRRFRRVIVVRRAVSASAA